MVWNLKIVDSTKNTVLPDGDTRVWRGSMTKTLPKKLGKYTITRILGKGAMGIVYEGTDPVIERQVAIKTIHKHLLEGEDGQALRDRFKREAQAAGRLMHHNIVAVYEYGEEQGLPFIAMEYVKGRELKEYIAEQSRFEVAQIVDIMSQTLSAMAYVHAASVIHRDLKPANIILLDNGQVKVADFGIARVRDSSMTQIGAVMGTPSYMSPEQFMGQRTDKRADIFSLGVILYRLLTGEMPFPGEGVATIMQKVLNAPVEKPTTYNFDLPKGFDGVIKKALAKRPTDRFSCAEDFLVAIKAAADGTANDAEEGGNEEATLLSMEGNEAQAQETVMAMLEMAYELSPEGQLTHNSRKRIKAKTERMGLDPGMVDMLDKVVSARFAPTEGAQERTISLASQNTLGTQQKNGVLILTSDPDKATVLVDGEELGQTPLTLPQVKAGSRKILVRTADHFPASRIERVVAGKEKKIHIILEAQTGRIRANATTFSEAYPATFFLDDAMIGRAPLTVEDVSAGPHTYRLEAPGHQGVSGEISLSLDEACILEEILTPLPGRIVLHSVPDGARIWLDGEKTSHKTHAEVTAEAGEHTVKLTLPNHLDYTTTLEVLPEGVTEAQATLQSNRGRLHLVSVPKGATIWLNGKKTKHKTDIILKILTGEHDVTLQKEGYQNISKTIAIEPEGYEAEIFRLQKGASQPVESKRVRTPPARSRPSASPSPAVQKGAASAPSSPATQGVDSGSKRPFVQEQVDTYNRERTPSGPGQWLQDNGDGTLIDTRHGLVSLKDLSCFDEHTWEEAMAMVATLAEEDECGLTDGSRAGDWRLPTKMELPLLIEWKKTDLFLGVQASYGTREEVKEVASSSFSFFRTPKPQIKTFSSYREPNYWSLESTGSSASSAWNISLYNGKISLYSKMTVLNIWPVRTQKT